MLRLCGGQPERRSMSREALTSVSKMVILLMLPVVFTSPKLSNGCMYEVWIAASLAVLGIRARQKAPKALGGKTIARHYALHYHCKG